MATTPGYAEVLASNVAAIYANAETVLIEKMAAYTAAGLESPEWITNLAITLAKFRSVSQGIATQARAEAMAGVVADAVAALEYGYRSAATELGTTIAGQVPGKSAHAVTALAAQMARTTDQASFDLVTSAHRALREVVTAAQQGAMLGVESAQQAAQRALNTFADRGITSVGYRGGRSMRIEHYVEMSMRTGLMNAALEGHALKMDRDGYDLVQVSDVAQECKVCRPFEGKVLALKGGAGPREVPSEIDGGTVKVTVTATLAAAKDSGLFHPNCRHTMRAFLPGISTIKYRAETADPKGNDQRVRQRALERTLREAKRREAAAITPRAKREAKALTKTRRDRLTAHIDQHNLKRLPARERITGQFGQGKASGPKPPTTPFETA